MNCSTPGLPVHSPTPRVDSNSCPLSRWCHPLLSPSPPTFNLSQHQGLFKWVSSLHQVAKVLSFRFHISPSNEHSGLISFRLESSFGWISLQSKGLSRVFSNTTVQKHQLFGAQLFPIVLPIWSCMLSLALKRESLTLLFLKKACFQDWPLVGIWKFGW